MTLAIAVVGVMFAAVAAWGAVMTVQLTRRMQVEAALTRVLEALLSVKYAAMALEDAPPQSEGLVRFRDAQQDLDE